jgi:type IV secretion system protein VirB10
MQRSPELEALSQGDDPVIADNAVRRKQLIGGAVLVLLGIVAGYLVLAGRQPPVRDMLDGDEEFTTTTFRPPSFVREGEPEPDPPAPEIVQIPPPPPPPPPAEEPDTTEFDVPPPPVPGAPPPSEAVEAPVEEFPERFRSKLVVVDNATADGQGNLTGDDGEGLTVAGEDRSSKFLAAASSIGDRGAKAREDRTHRRARS